MERAAREGTPAPPPRPRRTPRPPLGHAPGPYLRAPQPGRVQINSRYRGPTAQRTARLRRAARRENRPRADRTRASRGEPRRGVPPGQAQRTRPPRVKTAKKSSIGTDWERKARRCVCAAAMRPSVYAYVLCGSPSARLGRRGGRVCARARSRARRHPLWNTKLNPPSTFSSLHAPPRRTSRHPRHDLPHPLRKPGALQPRPRCVKRVRRRLPVRGR